MKILPLLPAFLLAPVLCQGQQANVWYFGDRAGIDFNSGTAAPLTNSTMKAYEGCASICDLSGGLLFYSNGGPLNSPGWLVGAVYDRDHDVMPNGSLASSGGCNSATQGTLIVQDPGDAGHYYLFTTDCTENSLAGGLRYSEVDMDLNGGLGDVATIGTPLLSGVHEAMAGIRHANGTDVWVVVHATGNSQFHAFLVSASGIGTPITTSIGPVQGPYTGQLAASLDGTRLYYGTPTASTLFDFDPATGVLSDPVDLAHSNATAGSFASEGRYLYTAEFISPYHIYQYDLFEADVQASEQTIGTGNGLQPQLQRGPDGKIYLARNGEQYLGVINAPNAAGLASDFQLQGLHLAGRECAAGLPNFVNDLLAPIATGIRSAQEEATLQCWVSDDGLQIRTGGSTGHARFTIFRSDGALVREGSLVAGTALVPVPSFVPGLYVVRLSLSNDRHAAASFVITR